MSRAIADQAISPLQDDDSLHIHLGSKKFDAIKKEVEAALLGHYMTQACGNKRRAAEIAGLSYDRFNRMMENYTVKSVFRVV